jgi:hypothetical protein
LAATTGFTGAGFTGTGFTAVGFASGVGTISIGEGDPAPGAALSAGRADRATGGVGSLAAAVVAAAGGVVGAGGVSTFVSVGGGSSPLRVSMITPPITATSARRITITRPLPLSSAAGCAAATGARRDAVVVAPGRDDGRGEPAGFDSPLLAGFALTGGFSLG